MNVDDPRRPLLGDVQPSRLRRVGRKLCSTESWRRRLPITIWLPKYNLECLFRDAVAGITVGLTSIPQGIAYAIVAGLPPQVGLYSSIFPGYVYMLFGSCKDVTVGPTAILSALLAKYVAKSPDFAYLASFLSGCVIFLLGVLQLGFLLDFISKPVISAFTTAAALQIGAAQLKSLFRISGSSGSTFISALRNFFVNIKTVHLWDTVLGVSSIIALVALKYTSITPAPETSPHTRRFAHVWTFVVRARNALVVFTAAIVAYILNVNKIVPFALTGKIEGGLPHVSPPPFSTTVNNSTVDFEGMLGVFGPEGFVIPLVAILESIAIAKAFAGTTSVDATQEMLAIGACNILSSFCQSMPSTGSFTRTALNHASGVLTPAGAFFKATLVLLAVTLLAEAFYFIPRATLAAVILVAMASLIDYRVPVILWRHSKMELLVYAVCVCVGVGVALEWGIVCGAACDVLRGAAAAARPALPHAYIKVGNQDCLILSLLGPLLYSSAEHIPREVRKRVLARTDVIVLDAAKISSLDLGVAENLIAAVIDLERSGHKVLMWNFSEECQRLLAALAPGAPQWFVAGPSIDQHILVNLLQTSCRGFSESNQKILVLGEPRSSYVFNNVDLLNLVKIVNMLIKTKREIK